MHQPRPAANQVYALSFLRALERPAPWSATDGKANSLSHNRNMSAPSKNWIWAAATALLLSACATREGSSVGAAPGVTTGRAEGASIRNEPMPLDVSSALFPLTERQ